MSTLENTVSMMKTLPEADLQEIQKLTAKLFQRRRGSQMTDEEADEAVGRYLKPMSREAIMKNIEIAEQEIADGKFRSADEVFNELEHRYRI